MSIGRASIAIFALRLLRPSLKKEEGWAYVVNQPSSLEEAEAAMEAAEGCPTESIGFDGDLFDWSAIPPMQD